MKHHYVYRSYEPLGRSYIGCRSCTCPIVEDPYLGSYKDKTFDPTHKEILAVCDTREEALRTEMFFHEMYDVVRNPAFANRAKQTSTGFNTEGTTPSEETKQKLREANIGKTHSDETKQKISEAQIGKKISEETKQKIREARIGKTLSDETKKKISEVQIGKTLSDESKQKIRETLTGKRWWVNASGETTRAKKCPGPDWQLGRKWKG